MIETTDRDRDLVESYFGSPYRIGKYHGALAEALAQLVARVREAARREAIEECERICDEEYFACDIRDRIRALALKEPRK